MGSSESRPIPIMMDFDYENRNYQMALALHLSATGTELPKALPPLAIACQALTGPDLHGPRAREDRNKIMKYLRRRSSSLATSATLRNEVGLWFRPVVVPYGDTFIHHNNESSTTTMYLVDDGETTTVGRDNRVVVFPRDGGIMINEVAGSTVLAQAGSSRWERSVRLFALDKYRFWRAVNRLPEGVRQRKISTWYQVVTEGRTLLLSMRGESSRNEQQFLEE